MKRKPILVTKATLPPMEEYIEALKPIWESAWLTNMGDSHQQLEKELCKYLEVENLVLFTNGHLALELLIQGMKLKGEIITTPFSFVSTTHSIVRNHLKPVFCDINEEDYTMDITKIEELITEKTTAILPVHVYGNICDIEFIEKIAKKYNLKVIYDAAHTFGESYKGKGIGCFGDASMFSFHATKVYNTIEGGAVSTNDKKLCEDLEYLKNFGIADKENVKYIGGNAKMNEFQAAMGLCNLKHIDENIKKREYLTDLYRELLQDIEGIYLNQYKPEVKYNYAYMPIRVEENITGYTRDKLYETLAERGIYARKYFYPCINALECYRGIFSPEETPVADKVSKQILTLPIYPDLEEDIVREICEIIKNA